MKNVFPYVFTNNILAVELILAVDLKLLLDCPVLKNQKIKKKYSNIFNMRFLRSEKVQIIYGSWQEN